MEKLPLSGLRFRIAAALAVVLALFIVLSEVSVSRLTRLVMTRYATVETGDAATPDGAKDAAIEQGLVQLRRPVLFYLVTGAVLALILSSFAVNRLAVRPLHRLGTALEKVAEGKLDTKVPIEGSLEIASMGRAFNHMTETLRAQQAELKRRMVEITANAEALQTAQEQIIRSAKLASVGTLAAGVAHEIGNPLTGLLGLTESLETGVDKAAEAKFLALMKSEILRIDRIIRELLSYARAPEHGDAEAVQCDFFAVLENVRALLVPQSIFDHIEWSVSERRKIPPLAVSQDDLTQVFLNLALNAGTAMKGKGRLTVDLEMLSTWQRSMNSPKIAALKICIADTGPGVPLTLQERIFDPFFTTAETGKGSGLGLAVSQNLIERVGGDLTLDADYKDGARFVMVIPFADKRELGEGSLSV